MLEGLVRDLCKDRVVIVTGAGRGIGRAHAIEYASQGARLVVNDSGVEVDGSGGSHDHADATVNAIRNMGGEAVASYDDVSDWEGAKRLIELAVETYGGLDVLVNNAGILRDRMLVNMSCEEWDEVVRVHMRGTFAPTRVAAEFWRDRVKSGASNDARVINTSSPSGLYGNVGQANYGAAKAGIAAFSIIAATELGRYGVTVNAIAPGARTRMTDSLGILDEMGADAGEFDTMAPENISPVVVWLGSSQSRHVTGRVFNIWGGRVSVAEGWHAGPTADKHDRWESAELGEVLTGLLAEAAPNADVSGLIPAAHY